MAILNNYLKSIADAIRTKKGSTNPINAQNFANEIELLQGLDVNEFITKMNNKTLDTIVFPEGLTMIDRAGYVNSDTPEVNIYLPKTFEGFQEYALGLTKGKVSVHFQGTIQDWLKTKTFKSSYGSYVVSGGYDLYCNGELIKNIYVTNSCVVDMVTDRYSCFASVKLENVTLSKDFTPTTTFSIFNSAYINNIIIEDGISYIGSSMFENAILTNKFIYIPASVTELKNRSFCFYNTSNVVFELDATTPPILNISAFKNTSMIQKIYVPAGSLDAYKTATNWSSYASKMVEKNTLTLSVPSSLLNNSNYTYSINNGSTWNQFTSETTSLPNIANLKVKNLSNDVTLLVGTTQGGSEIGVISNAETQTTITGNTTIYITIQ